MRTYCAIGLLMLGGIPVSAEVVPNSLFASHAVLQRNVVLPVWGSAAEGERVTVDFQGQHLSTVARGGKWRVELKPLKASATAAKMVIKGRNQVVIEDLLVGDVWVCAGQSNMERMLGPQPPQKDLVDWKNDAAAANYPAIRQYKVPLAMAKQPVADAGGQWQVCNPRSVLSFSAVGYYFGRDVHLSQKVPVGLLFSALGGTPAESWTSAQGLSGIPEFRGVLADLRGSGPTQVDRWFKAHDIGTQQGWQATVKSKGWSEVNLPNPMPDSFDGVVWFRREVTLPANWSGKAAVLSLGPIDDQDTTWVNGVKVGTTAVWNVNRNYKIPAGLLKPGKNNIAVRCLDTGQMGGLWGRPDTMKLVGPGEAISLAGNWLSRSTCGTSPDISNLVQSSSGPGRPSVLNNAMIAPLQQLPIKGVIWYQGETNVERAAQYRQLFPRLITDWRNKWKQPNMPFLFVQVAPFKGLTPELREAQWLTQRSTPNTAMAVITDAGDAGDIHPSEKRIPGQRLALAARTVAYREKIEYSGPTFENVKFRGGEGILTFGHADSGLVARGGPLTGFTIAGKDGRFVTAQAEIKGKTVRVWSGAVPKPTAVRYGWANVPVVNLYNGAALPASPFRTDTAAME